MASAFASDGPPRILKFHLSPLEYPRPRVFSVRLRRRRGLTRAPTILLSCRELSIAVGLKDRQESGLEHSGFLAVDVSPDSPRRSIKSTCMTASRNSKGCGEVEAVNAATDDTRALPLLDYERFNRNNFSIRFRSWYYRGCWHQTCPPIDPRYTKDLICAHSDRGSSLEKSASLSIVTTSPCQEWVISAPAAFLGCGSDLSGSLSGIEP